MVKLPLLFRISEIDGERVAEAVDERERFNPPSCSLSRTRRRDVFPRGLCLK